MKPEETNSISIKWCVNDIKDAMDAREDKIDISDEECMGILYKMKVLHDPCIGITWNNIDHHLDEFIEGSINHIDPDDIDDLPDELKTYRVKATCETYHYIDVKASSSDEAVEIANDSNQTSYKETGEQEWSVDFHGDIVEPKKVIRLTGHYDEVPIEDYKEVN